LTIKGLSEVRRLPRIGKIRLGIKKENAKGVEYPAAVDYFVCKADEQTSELAAQAFKEVYGEKPRELDVMFPVEDPTKFFSQFYRRYGSSTGLLCKGDGEKATQIDRETGEMLEIDCDPMECEWAEKKHCRPVGTLQFLLYKVPGLGIWQIDTSSYHSIVNLNSAIDFVRTLTGGKIAWIPLKLIIRPKEVQVEGRKKVVYVMDLANEHVRLEQILAASRKTPAQFLLEEKTGIKPEEVTITEPDYDEAPDDLYPASLINNNKEKVMDAETEGKAETETDPIDNELHRVWDILSVPEAKRKATLNKPDLDKEQLLVNLKKEVARRQQAGEASATQARDFRKKEKEVDYDKISDGMEQYQKELEQRRKDEQARKQQKEPAGVPAQSTLFGDTEKSTQRPAAKKVERSFF